MSLAGSWNPHWAHWGIDSGVKKLVFIIINDIRPPAHYQNEEKEQDDKWSDPENRLSVERRPSAEAVSAAANVRRIIPK